MQIAMAAISLGFLGSFHCIGMCGPIALSLPVHQKNRTEKILAIFSYNVGRIVTYAAFGLVFGLIGQSFAFFGFQQKLSILLGILILLGLIVPQRFVAKSKVMKTFYAGFGKLKNRMAAQFQKRGIRSFLSIGLLNGLLPCGLVYIAIAGATSTGSIWQSMLFMGLFGAGTIPFMFAISYTSHLITLKARNTIRKAMPLVIGLTAVLLILRGSNLGIPYISPKLNNTNAETAACHKSVSCCHKK
ncbi:MAG: sulfite exporter TauE/SafE family protein [Bacteroidetes bacterium]|jgi:sulfite exporter TauE/SafE|nr:sulfite exporter TauE/SafE family protein [Bacteroidota bacterium]